MLILMVSTYACQQQLPPSPIPRNENYDKAISFLDNQNDSAYYYFNKVVAGTKDSLQIARSYNNMAVLQYEAGDYFGAQEMLIHSLKFLNEQNKKDYRCLSSDFNELGLTYMKLKNYDAALPLYGQAIKFSTSDDAKRIYLNNKALTFSRKKEYLQALAIYQAILPHAGKSQKEFARSLSNMAITKWRAHPGYVAAPLLNRALSIRKNIKDRWGQNASYDHLSVYYMQSRPDSALFYAKAMYETAISLHSPDDQLEALQKLIRLSEPRQTKIYFANYQKLSDSLQTARNAAKNQFALIRYDTEKRKADNLKLQKENTVKQYEIFKKNILLVTIVSVFLLLTGIAFFWYRKRKQRLALEARERELRLSQKVHDGVANGLYRLMKHIENQKNLDPEPLLDEIELLYLQSRDISYEPPENIKHDFNEKINELLTSFASPAIKVAIVGNKAELWKKISEPVKRELEYVLQELMVNMSKHSHATSVAINFKQSPGKFEIVYTDNGIGFPEDTVFGNGLNNTENRIIGIGGVLTFDNKLDKGIRITLCLPLL